MQLMRDLADRFGRVTILQGSGAWDDGETGGFDLRRLRDQFLHDAITDQTLMRVVAPVLQG